VVAVPAVGDHDADKHHAHDRVAADVEAHT
jgi:hypothetical protein